MQLGCVLAESSSQNAGPHISSYNITAVLIDNFPFLVLVGALTRPTVMCPKTLGAIVNFLTLMEFNAVLKLIIEEEFCVCV